MLLIYRRRNTWWWVRVVCATLRVPVTGTSGGPSIIMNTSLAKLLPDYESLPSDTRQLLEDFFSEGVIALSESSEEMQLPTTFFSYLGEMHLELNGERPVWFSNANAGFSVAQLSFEVGEAGFSGFLVQITSVDGSPGSWSGFLTNPTLAVELAQLYTFLRPYRF